MSDEQTVLIELEKAATRSDYFSTLVYYEQNEKNLDEKHVQDRIQLNECLSDLIKTFHVLNGQRQLLIVAKSSANVSQIAGLVANIFKSDYPSLKRASIPMTCGNVRPLVLYGEATNEELKIVNNDRNIAVKHIEAKTGLRSSEINNVVFFSGLMFQFLILNEIFNENSNVLGEINQNIRVKTDSFDVKNAATNNDKSQRVKGSCLDWRTLYDDAVVKGHFKIKPKQENDAENNLPDFYYDIYMFTADLTDLNTDGLINASNSSLHPGYVGDGISRRIREKGGKPLQDECKRILKQERTNDALDETDVVLTKSHGKLKAKYILHSIAPTWTQHIVNNITDHSHSGISSPTTSLSSMTTSVTSSPSSSISSTHLNLGEKFEYLMEQTFFKILKQAHDPKLQLTSLAMPISASSLGGAFDLPVELCAHSLYTQLCDYKVDKSTCLKTICITSLEPETVKTLLELFTNYTENYSESAWAVPLSPMTKLLSQAVQEYGSLNGEKCEEEHNSLNDKKDCLKNNEGILEHLTDSLSISDHDTNNPHPQEITHQRPLATKKTYENITVKIKIDTTNEHQNHHDKSELTRPCGSRLVTINDDQRPSKTYRANKPRTISNSSHSSENSFDRNRLGNMSHESGVGGGSAPSNTTNYFRSLEFAKNCDSCCLFCQK